MVMIRVVKPLPGTRERRWSCRRRRSEPWRSVVTLPLSGCALLPPAEAVTSSGLTRSRPAVLGDRGRRRTGVAVSNVTVTVLRRPRDDVLGVVDRLADRPAATRGRGGELVGVAGAVGDRGDVRGRVVPADDHDVQVARGLRAWCTAVETVRLRALRRRAVRPGRTSARAVTRRRVEGRGVASAAVLGTTIVCCLRAAVRPRRERVRRCRPTSGCGPRSCG